LQSTVSGGTTQKTGSKSKMTQAIDAVRTLILDESLLPSGITVGVVSFASAAQVIFAPTEIKSLKDRQALSQRLTLVPDGTTAIGQGINKAAEVSSKLLAV
jgi:Mg-chelatase subunit ChlD